MSKRLFVIVGLIFCVGILYAQNTQANSEPKKHWLRLALVHDSEPNEFVWMIEAKLFKSLNGAGIKKWVSYLPKGDQIVFGYPCVEVEGEEKYWAELSGFSKFCNSQNIELVIIDSG